MQKVQITGERQNSRRLFVPRCMSPSKALRIHNAGALVGTAHIAAGPVPELADTNIRMETTPFLEVLAQFLREDLRRSAVMSRFPDSPWPELELGARQALSARENAKIGQKRPGRPRKTEPPAYSARQVPPHTLTNPELALIVLEWYSPRSINFQYLAEECFLRDLNTIHSKVMQLETHYGDKRQLLKEREIFAFEACNEQAQYTLDAVTALLPEYTAEELRLMINTHYPHKAPWSSGESAYILTCLQQQEPLEHMSEQLLFRRPSEIRTKAAALARRHGVAAYFEKSEAQRLYEQRISEFCDLGLTRAALETLQSESETSERSERSRRSEKFTGAVFSDVQTEISRRGGVPFTKAENAIISSKVQGQLTLSECKAELPFRSAAEINDRIRQAELVTVRQKKFANNMERLIYEAQWYSLMADNAGGRKRRARGGVELEQLKREAAQMPRRKTEGESDDESDDARAAEKAAAKRAIIEKRMQSRQRNLEQKRVQRLERQQRRPRRVTRAAAVKKEYRHRNNTLLEEALWFQSITGNGAAVAEGAKRKRVPTYHLIPEFHNRQKLKNAQKKLMEQKYNAEPRLKLATPSDFDASVAESTIQELQDAMSDTPDDVKSSPFDPCSIVDDTLIDTGERDIFNSQISLRSLFPLRINFSPSVHEGLDADKGPVVNDVLAARVIRDHEKGYTCLPLSFPPFRVHDNVNPRNILHIRYLLYPQHTEQYILAQPKSNQLDPVNEIQKVFQIHYALYFSYSEELRDIIYTEYCEELMDLVLDNDFSRFMTVIDKWNALMLELTPYPVEIDPSIDINASLRDYLPPSYNFQYNVKDFRLQKFYMEVLEAGERAKALAPRPGRASFSKMPPVHTGFHNLPEVFVSRFRHLRPMAYSVAFIDALTHLRHLSRFCVQQMILRAYVRIVSPDSRKLRSYKAFSAEVYGELLPSFVSEVLTKLEFQPGQKFYDLGCGVGNATLQAALEFGATFSGGCEIMDHALHLASLQQVFIRKQLQVFGLKPLNLSFDLYQSFVANEKVLDLCKDCDVILVNNFLFEFPLNVEVGKLLHGLKPGSKIISLRNFIPPRYKSGEEKNIFDYLKVEKFEISDYFSVSWTANKVPYYISTVQKDILPEYLPEPEKRRLRSTLAS